MCFVLFFFSPQDFVARHMHTHISIKFARPGSLSFRMRGTVFCLPRLEMVFVLWPVVWPNHSLYFPSESLALSYGKTKEKLVERTTLKKEIPNCSVS